MERAGPEYFGIVELLEQREDLALQRGDLAQRGNVIQRQPVDPFEIFACRIRACEQLQRDDLLLCLVRDPLKLRKLGVDLLRRLRPAEFAAGDLRILHHDLGHDALVHDRLLLVGGRNQTRDKTAAEVFADNHGAKQDDAEAYRQAELRPNPEFEGKSAA